MKTKEDYQLLNDDERISFSEFPLAITLICLGFKLVALNKDPKTPERIDFIFDKNDAVEKSIASYWEGNLLVEPKAFWNISRELKSRMRSETAYVSY